MNGVHDVGGMHGFGPVPVDDDARFHSEWERLVFAMVHTVESQGVYTIDESRYGIERMDPAAYLDASYFERWLASLEWNLLQKGHISRSEIESARREVLESDDSGVIGPESRDPDLAALVREVFERPASYDRPDDTPRFDAGDRVRVWNIHPAGHTRCPRYVRRAVGEISKVRGNYVFPDASAHGEDRDEPLYTVAFDAAELWGPDAENHDDTIHVDLWEPHLQSADQLSEEDR